RRQSRNIRRGRSPKPATLRLFTHERPIVKTYHGQRTEQGCAVTVDGVPLRMRSDLSGNATTAFDWGFVGSGQLSLALLSDFLGDDERAKAMCQAFEEKVIADLPDRSWTMTDRDFAAALALRLAGGDAPAGANERHGETWA